MFVVTEDAVVPRSVSARVRASRWGHPALAIFRPGAALGALYVIAQMALLLAAAWSLRATEYQYRWLLAICGYSACSRGFRSLPCVPMLPGVGTPLHLRTACWSGARRCR